MKLTLKIICLCLASILAVTLGLFIYYLLVTKDASLDKSKLINMEKTISFYDSNGNFLLKQGDEKQITSISDIPLHVQRAFIAVEDKRFYNHNGIDFKGLTRAMLTNIKTMSFKEGGSTISQQLIKNTHLSNKKTITRKLSEIKLAKKLEKTYSKDEILEKYLNTIYFGDNCYGITSASNHYFGKEPKDLTVNEGAILAGIIKAPSNYSPFSDKEKCNKRKNIVLSLMFNQGYIDKKCYNENKDKDVITIEREEDNGFNYSYLINKDLNEIIKDYPFSAGNINVYTTLDKEVQNIIEKNIDSIEEKCDKSAIIMNANGQIKAYYSTCGDIARQVGSTIKPLLVYAPAIENNIAYSCSPILDEKTNFNGYSPSNYNDKYYGYVSVKESLAKSLNSCAVKLLNYTGVEKCKEYLKKMNYPFTENDNSLCLALGASENGVKLSHLTGMYSIFLNGGNYVKPYSIIKVESQNNGTIYKSFANKTKIFNEDTTHIVNDMLEYTVSSGTAKKLSYTNIPLCAKTGTVGNENGNYDAYNISFNSEQIVSVWFGNKDNTLMDNSITGGGKPTNVASEIWEELYKNKTPPFSYTKSKNVCEKYIDKIEYESGNNVLLANNLTPKRYTLKGLFKSNYLPKQSNRFNFPTIDDAEISVVNNSVIIKLEIPEYYYAYIYKWQKDKTKLVYDTFNNDEKLFIDKEVEPNQEYLYSVVPYFKFDKEIVKGKEIFLDKIKIPQIDIKEWWNDELE